MSLHPCCRSSVELYDKEAATEVATPKRGARKISARIGSALKWLTPTAILVLIPKCPLCVAAYIALGTGVSVALPVATWIRYGLLITCFAVLGYLALSAIRRWMPKHGVVGQ